MYVTEVTSHCVFVFTTDGKYVASFGQKGKKEGDFNMSAHVLLDKDGFVCVTDSNNDRMQCFIIYLVCL